MNSEYKIYTRQGDQGETSLIGGTRVPKYDERVEAYGTIDELKSYIGLIRDLQIDQAHREVLFEIQDRLFTTETLLAVDPRKETGPLPQLDPQDIGFLEARIDQMNQSLQPLKNFILPGGHPVVSHCHVARTICRRAERNALRLTLNHHVHPLVIQYLNRLSDFLFVLARTLAKEKGAPETPWIARL